MVTFQFAVLQQANISVLRFHAGFADRVFFKREPVAGTIGEPDKRQHHRYFDQHADHSDQGRYGVVCGVDFFDIEALSSSSTTASATAVKV